MSETLEHMQFPHLTIIEWTTLHRLATVAGDSVAQTLLRTGSPDSQRLAAHEFMQRELDDALSPLIPRDRACGLVATYHNGLVEGKLPDLSAQRQGKGVIPRDLVVDEFAFPTLAAIENDLRLAIEPPRDESRMRAAFFALKQGKLSMRESVKKARHLASCVITKPIGMASLVHVFVHGMKEGMTRNCLTRDEPVSLEAAFAAALREDYTVMLSYARAHFLHPS